MLASTQSKKVSVRLQIIIYFKTKKKLTRSRYEWGVGGIKVLSRFHIDILMLISMRKIWH